MTNWTTPGAVAVVEDTDIQQTMSVESLAEVVPYAD